MAKFRSAWCEARRQTMTPEDVADHILTQSAKPVLKCPDENCRKIKPATELVAVCCDPRNTECAFTPHFRTKQGDTHAENCLYGLWSHATDYVLSNRSEFSTEFPEANLLKSMGDIESELLPDAFVESYEPKDFELEVTEKVKQFMQGGSGREQALRKARCAIPQKTSRLALIVDMAIRLATIGKNKTGSDEGADNLRRSVPLDLAGRQTNYFQAFLNVTSLGSDYRTKYILCGEAIIYKTLDGYIAEYQKPLRHYSPDYPELPAYTPLNPKLFRSAFMAEVKAYAASGERCAIYSFSTHDLKESTCPMGDKKRCVVIAPRFRDAVVIRKRCIKRSSQNKTF